VSTRVNQYRLRRVLPHPQTGSLIRPTSRGSASPRGRDRPDTASTRRDVDVVQELTYLDSGRIRR
jgi:hypothetical protein